MMSSTPAPTIVSRIQSRWQFNEVSRVPAWYFSEVFKDYQLEGRILPIAGREDELPQTLVIHGARSDYTTLNGILYPLQTFGISSLSFNLSGHNTTTDVKIESTSLTNNLQESLRFAAHLGVKMHTVIGHSMGGALALKVAETYRSSVKKIVLLCPAIYSDIAYSKPFGSSFRDILSTPFNFLHSSSLRFLREFDGELMLIIGEYDGLRAVEFGGKEGTAAGIVKLNDDQVNVRLVNSAIPFEVIDSIEKSISSQRFKKVILTGCDHTLSAWLRADPVLARDLAREVAEFVTRPIKA